MQIIDITLKDLLFENGTTMLLKICKKRCKNDITKGYHRLEIQYFFNAHLNMKMQTIIVAYEKKMKSGRMNYSSYDEVTEQESCILICIESEKEFRNVLYELINYRPILLDNSKKSHEDEKYRFESYFDLENLKNDQEHDIKIYDFSRYVDNKCIYIHIIDFVDSDFCIVVTDNSTEVC